MNPRILTVAALLAASAACAYFLLSPERPPHSANSHADPEEKTEVSASHSADEGGAKAATGTPSNTAGKKPALNSKLFTAIIAMMSGTGGDGDGMPNPTPEDLARVLAKHGETAVNLVTAFYQQRDRRLLERALELFPNSPIVLMTAIDAVPHQEAKIGEKYGPNAERLALIERFKAADPNNPLPWIYSAQELFKSGATEEAIAEIRAALDRPAFYTYSAERTDAAQRLYEDLGLHPVEASLLATAALALPHMYAATQSSRMLMEWQKKATDSGDAAAADEALRLTYSLGRTFATPEASRMLIGQLVGISMESRALKALPADSQPGWLTVNPTQRLAEIERQKQNLNEIPAALESVIQSQNEEVLSAYLRRMRTEGEAAAFEWLRTQKQ